MLIMHPSFMLLSFLYLRSKVISSLPFQISSKYIYLSLRNSIVVINLAVAVFTG